MIYLGTNEIGHDATCIGFPELHSCQSITYQTTNYLFGWHDSSGSVAHLKAKADKFNTYVQNVAINHLAGAKRLVGVINANNRFSKESQDYWKEELLAIADALGFQGPVLGYRVTKHLGIEEGTTRGDKIYVRFEQNGNKWQVYYKTWSKLQYGAEVPEPDNNRHQFKGTTLGDKHYDHLRVLKRDTSSGKLHEIGHGSFTRFR